MRNSRCAFGRRQRRGRLVHDQDAGRRATAPWRSRPAAARRPAGRATRASGSSSMPSRSSSRARGGDHARRRSTTSPAMQRLAPEEDVGGDAELRDEVQLLVDDGDARPPRRRGRWRSATGRAVDPDLAVIVGVHAGEDLHQRRLAGAVLAHQRVHLAGAEVEVDAVERGDAGEALADAARAQQRAPLRASPARDPPRWTCRPPLPERRAPSCRGSRQLTC